MMNMNGLRQKYIQKEKNVENKVEGEFKFLRQQIRNKRNFLEVKGKVQNKDLQKVIDEVDDVPNSSQMSKMTTGRIRRISR